MKKIAGAVSLCVAGLITVTVVRCVWLDRAFEGDPETQEQFSAAVARLRPVVAALKAYHEQRGLYPARLSALDRRDLDASGLASGYVYGGEPADQVYASPACEQRWHRAFEGFVLKPVDEIRRLKSDFAGECLMGYRKVTLQSPNFVFYGPHTFSGVDRWAYYASFTDRWSIGWCSHEQTDHGIEQTATHNGACR